MLNDLQDQIVQSAVIDDRIALLRTRHARVVPGAESLCVGCDEEEHEELETLIDFHDDVCSETSVQVWEHGGGFIRDDYFDQYQYERQVDIYGKEVVDSKYWDDDEWTDDQRDEFTEIDFGTVTYWVDREA